MLCCCSPRTWVHRGDRLGSAPQFPLASRRPYHQQEPPPLPIRDIPPTSESDEIQALRLSSGIVAAVPVDTPDHGPVDLDQLLVDDSDGEDDRYALHRKATSTWNLIRKRLSCIISRDGACGKRTTSIGALSQEDLARRAELRRLMHKRIQDELQIEDSGKSPSSEPRTSIQQPLATILEWPGGGPRDTIEFAMSQAEARHPSPPGSMTGHKQSLEARPPMSANCVRACTSTGVKAPRPFPTPNPNPKPLPTKVAQDAAGIGDSHKPLYKCALHEPHILSGKDISTEISGNSCLNGKARLSSHDSQSWDTTSVLAMWLSAQGMGSRDQSLTRLETHKKTLSESSADLEQPMTAQTDFKALLQTSPKTQTCINLNETSSKAAAVPNKTQGLATDQLPQVKTRDLLHDNGISLSPSQDLAESYAIAMAFDDAVEKSSSKYTSVMPSPQATPVSSQQLNIPYPISDHILQNISTEPYSGKQFLSIPAIGSLRQCVDVIKRSGDSVEAQSTRDLERFSEQNGTKAPFFAAERPPSDIGESQLTLTSTISITPSASTSFRRREAELETIDRRFGAAIARKGTRGQVQSRFREEFELPARVQSRRGTFIAKVQRSLDRRSRTRSRSTDDLRNHSLPSHLLDGSSIPRRNHKIAETPKLMSPDAFVAHDTEHKLGSFDETGAKRLSQFHERPRSNKKLNLSPYVGMQKYRPSLERKKTDHTQSNFHSVLGDTLQPGSQPPGLEPLHDLRVTERSSQPSETIESDRTKGTRVENYMSRNDKWTFVEAPPSWVKFPIHNSFNRNGTATFKHDCVLSRDFALDAVGASQTIGRGHVGDRHVPESRSAKLTHRVASGFSRLLPFRHRNPADTGESLDSSDKSSEPSEILNNWLAEQANANGHVSARSRSLTNGSSSTRSNSAIPSCSAAPYAGSPLINVGNTSSANVFMGRDLSRPFTTVRLGGNCIMSNSPIPSDVFLTPRGGSPRYQSSDCLLPANKRSVTCPSLTRGVSPTRRGITISRALSWPKFELKDITLYDQHRR